MSWWKSLARFQGGAAGDGDKDDRGGQQEQRQPGRRGEQGGDAARHRAGPVEVSTGIPLRRSRSWVMRPRAASAASRSGGAAEVASAARATARAASARSPAWAAARSSAQRSTV